MGRHPGLSFPLAISETQEGPDTRTTPHQERLGTTPYSDPRNPDEFRFFRSVLFLNTVQSLTSALSALLYALATQRQHASEPLHQTLGLGDAIKGPKSLALPSPASKDGRKVSSSAGSAGSSWLSRLTGSDRRMLSKMLQCALLHSIGSPFAFVSLRHIDYPTMILAKSCKLVPVMLMNILLYRRRFASHKYFVVLMVTIGISVFTLANPSMSSKKSKGGAASNSATGLLLLLVSLMIDGATNSTQDEIFVKFKTTGVQMMFWMNTFATLLTAAACVLPIPSIPLMGYHNPAGSATTELSTALEFISSHPSVLHDILAFSLAGALGQLFIFDTLQHFGSLTLVTITVTRKLFTMLLSVFIYNHDLAMTQWVGVAIVFAAIALEAQHKRSGGLSKKQIEKEQPARLKNI